MAKSSSTSVWNPEDVKITRQLNASFRIQEGVVYHIQFLSALYEDPSRGSKDAKGKAKMAPPMMARVLNLQDGREIDLIIATLPQARLEEAYTGDEYVGKCFRLVKQPKRDGKRYCDYEFDEIDASSSPHFRELADVKKNAKNFGPREVKAAKGK